MARNKDTAGALVAGLVKAAAAANVEAGTPVTDDQLEKIWQAACDGLYQHDQANAVVASTGTVTSGAGAGGAVTATNVGGIT